MNFLSLWKSAKWYVFSSLTGKVLVFLSIPFYTKYLSVVEYGAVETAMSLSQLCAVMMSLYMDASLVRYFHFSKTSVERERLFSVTFTFVALYGISALLMLVLAGPWIANYMNLNVMTFVLALICIYLGQLNNLFIAFLKQEVKSKKVFQLESIASISSIFLGLLFLIWFKQGEISKFLGLILGAIVLLFINLYSFYRQKLVKFMFDKELTKELVLYGLPFIPNYIGSWVMDLSDRLVLAKMSNLTSVAIYSVANQLSRVIYIAQDALTKVQYPHAMKALVDNDALALKSAKSMNSKVLAFVVIIYLSMIIYIDPILKIFQKDEYLDAKWVFAILGISFLFTSQYRTSIAIINYFKKNIFTSSFAIGAALLNLGLNIILVPKLQIIGAAWATVASSSLYTVLVMSYAYSLKKYKIDYVQILICALVLLITLAIDIFYIGRLEVTLNKYIFKTLLLGSVCLLLIKTSGLLSLAKKEAS